MRLRNSDGDPVDPVPFLVVALLAVLVAVSWGPLYLKAHGVAEPPAVAASVGLAAVAVGAAFYRLVWSLNTDVRAEVPAAVRFGRLVYAIAIGVVAVLALMALLYV